jgi:acetyl-CoA C-acetyltransferase
VSDPARIVGWSQVTRFDGEPLAAWAEALRATGVPPTAIDSLDVLYCQSWPYDDPPRRLADAVGAGPRRLHYAGIGGTTPLQLLAAAAARIERGEADVCAVVGGEALATKRSLKKQGERPAWSHRHPEPPPFPFEAPFHPSEVAHQVFQATTTFALRDVARRAHLGLGIEEHQRANGALFAPMTEVAARNPHAWFPVARSAEEVATVTAENRMVAFPHPKLVVSFMDVDQSAAVVLASPAAAERLGIPPDRQVVVRGWGEARDPDYVAEHPDLWRSPGMATALDAALSRAGVDLDAVDRLDLYSCFPSAVSFALDALGLAADDRRAPFTVTGGLPYAGGPGSCYALGATVAMAEALTAAPGTIGMVTGVGMHLSKHAAVVLSTEDGRRGTPSEPPPVARLAIADEVDDEVTIAAYTVHHGRDGEPTDALLVCDVGDGSRCYARSTDAGFLAALEETEWVGRRVTIASSDGVNSTVGSTPVGR